MSVDVFSEYVGIVVAAVLFVVLFVCLVVYVASVIKRTRKRFAELDKRSERTVNAVEDIACSMNTLVYELADVPIVEKEEKE